MKAFDLTPESLLPLGNGAPPGIDQDTIARFTHVARLPMLARVGLPIELALEVEAHFIGCSVAALKSIRRRHERLKDDAAKELLQDQEVARALKALPTKVGERLVILGDSVTADSLSWAELLGSLVQQVGVGVDIVNLSVSAITTGEVIGMFELVEQAKPTTVMLMAGTNDARRHGPKALVRAVDISETKRNLNAFRELVRQETAARLLAITPAPFNQDTFDAFMPKDNPVRWYAHELAEVAAQIRAVFPEAIDVHEGLGKSATEQFWIPDGLHPDVSGHQVILRHILRNLNQAS